VVTRPPDGYTLGLITASPTIAYHMGKLNFNPVEDLTPIVRYGVYLYGLVVRSDSPWQDGPGVHPIFPAEPAKSLLRVPGGGNSPPPRHGRAGRFGRGIQWVHVPYKGVAESNTALLGGHVDAVSDSSGWAPLVDAGKFRLLVTFGEKRSTRYPQVPILKEVGYDMLATGPIALIGPKGISKPVVQKLEEGFRKAMDDADFQAVMKKFDFTPAYLGSEDYEKLVREDSEKIQKLVKKLGLDKKQ